MTQEQVKNIIEKIKTQSDYPWHHELDYLLQNDAQLRSTIELLSQVQENQARVIEHQNQLRQNAEAARKAGKWKKS